MMRVVTLGNCDSCAAAIMPAGPDADDEHVDLVGELVGPVDAGAGGGLDARVAGDVAVVVELHGCPHFVVSRSLCERAVRIVTQ